MALTVTHGTTDMVDCVIPAAGLSSRMGAWKPMLPYHGCTLLDVAIKHALQFCSRVIVVAGYRADELIRRYQHQPLIQVVVNAEYQQGMLSSIQKGITAVTSARFFITHADMPCIDPQVFRMLLQARHARVVFAGNQHQTGHPVLIDSALIPHILALPITAKMKQVLQTGTEHYLQLNAVSGIFYDIDTPEKYQQLIS
ncbi:NTP transferase domain-containing protein [Photobacterium andalusiense]|uniref:Molybdenum cofactor cytidylyltransferase n=1 Tax=Photobacterium andalusiense TaxID=2204296 RepID=A0A1Y6MFX4_9GAMM|nr:NTP transferase domain-containing protein [Photobacterium andalusiense]SMY35485.1 Molybdenum cofactor cytidylyltransferase [Photobacterium andalusiense]